MLLPSSKHYARLKRLLPVDKLPDNLGFLKDGIVALFDDLYYKDLVIEKNRDGSAAFYKLSVMSYRRVKLTVPGSGGLSLVFFPDTAAGLHTEVPLSLSYRWDVLQYLSIGQFAEALGTTREAYDLLLAMLRIQKRALLEEAIRKFFGRHWDAPDAFAQWFPYDSLSLDSTSTTPYDDLFDQLETLGHNVADIVFDDIVYADTGLDDGLGLTDANERMLYLLERWIGELTLEGLADMLIPQAQASILKLPVAIEFPEYLLKRADGQDGPAQLLFDVGKLSYATDKGFEFLQASNLSFARAEILNTGFTLEFDTATLDLSKQENITGASQDGRPVEFLGVHIPEAYIDFPPAWQGPTGEDMSLLGTDLIIGSEGGFSGLISLDGPTGGHLERSLGPLTLNVETFTMDIHQDSVEQFLSTGYLTIDGIGQSAALETGTGGALEGGEFTLQQFPYTASYGTGDVYHLTVDLTGISVVNFAGFELTLNDLQLSFDRNGFVLGLLSGSFTVNGVKDAHTGANAQFDIDLTITDTGLTVTLSNSPALKLCFSRDYLTPLDTGCEPILDSGAQSELWFSIGSGGIAYTTESGQEPTISFDSIDFIQFTKSEILQTGLWVEFNDAVIDLSRTANIAQLDSGYADTFLGAYIQQATIGFPPGWTQDPNQNTYLEATNLIVGTEGGITGDITLVAPAGDALEIGFGPVQLRFTQFDMSLDHGTVATFSAGGMLVIEGITEVISDETGLETGDTGYGASGTSTEVLQAFPFTVTYGTDDVYHVTVDFTGISLVSFGGATLSLTSMAFSFDNGGLISGHISGGLTIEGVKDAMTDANALFAVDLYITETGTTVTLTNSPVLKLCFSRDYLTPLGTGCEPILETGAQSELWFSIGTGGIAYTTESGQEPNISFESIDFIHFTKSEILQTGLWVEVNNAEIDLSRTANIHQLDSGYADTFLGAFIQQATIGLPPGWTQDPNQTTYLEATNLIVGTEGGITGDIALVAPAGDSLEIGFGAVQLRFDQFDMSLYHGSVETFSAGGTLVIEGITEVILDETGLQTGDTGYGATVVGTEVLQAFPFTVSYGTDDVYHVSVDFAGISLVSFGGATLSLSSMEFSFDSDGLIAGNIVGGISFGAIKDAITGEPAVFTVEIDITETGTTVTLTNSPTLKLCFSRDYLTPLGTGCEPILETGAQSELWFSIGTGGIAYTSESGLEPTISFESIEFIHFTKSEILQTGLWVEVNHAVIDLSRTTNISQLDSGYEDTFLGAYIQQATIGLPPGWTQDPNQTTYLEATNLIVGTEGGVTGNIALVAPMGDSLEIDFGPVLLRFDQFNMVFDHGSVESFSAGGTLVIEGVTHSDETGSGLVTGFDTGLPGDPFELAFTASYNANGQYTVTVATNKFVQVGGFSGWLEEVSVTFDGDGLIAAHMVITVALDGIKEVLTGGDDQPAEFQLRIDLFEDGSTSVALLNDPILKITFGDYLTPLDEITCQPLTETGAQSELWFSVGPGGLSYTTGDTGTAGLQITSLEFIKFTKSEILGSGISVGFYDAVLDLSKSENILEVGALRPDAFIGAAIQQATFGLPDSWSAETGSPAALIGQNIIVGTEGGFTGVIELDVATSDYINIPFGPVNIQLHTFNTSITQNNIDFLNASGILTIDGVNEVSTGSDPAELYEFPYTLDYDTDGTYSIHVANSIPVQLVEGYEVVIDQLDVSFDKDGFISASILASLTLGDIYDASMPGDVPVVLQLLIEINAEDGNQYAVTLINRPLMRISFSRSIFVPVGTGDEPIDDTGAQAELLVTFDTGADVSWSTADGLQITSVDFVSFTRSEVMGTGLIIDFFGGVIDLSKVENIDQISPEIDASGEFLGAFISQASITLPSGFGEETGADGNLPLILGENLIFGNMGGFSGALSLVGGTDETLDLNFGGVVVRIEDFYLHFDQSELITGSNISGVIVIPGLKCSDTQEDIELQVDIDFLGDGLYEVTAGAPGCPLSIGSLDISINQLTLQFDRDGIVLEGTNIQLTVALPSNDTNGANDINVELQLLPDGFKLVATDTDGITFYPGPLEVTIDYFELEYHQDLEPHIQSTIEGSVIIPSEGADTEFEVAVALTNTGYSLTATAVDCETGFTNFDIGSAEVSICEFMVELSRETDGTVHFVESSIAGSVVFDNQELEVEITIYDDGFGIETNAVSTDGVCFDVASLQLCIHTFNATYRKNAAQKLTGALEGSLLFPTDEGTSTVDLLIALDETGFLISADAVDTDGVPIKVGGVEVFLDAFSLTVQRNADKTYQFLESEIEGTVVVPSQPEELVIDLKIIIQSDKYILDAEIPNPDDSNVPWVNFSWFQAALHKLHLEINTSGGSVSLGALDANALLKFDDMEDPSTNQQALVDVGIGVLTAPDPNEWTFTATNASLQLKIGDTILELNTFKITFSKEQIISSEIAGKIILDNLEENAVDGQNGQSIILTGGFDDYGFHVAMELLPPFETEVAGYVGITVHKIGIGKVVPTGGNSSDATWYLQLGRSGEDRGLDFSLLQEIPMVNKFIPSRVNLNSLKLYDDGSAEDADIVFVWEGLDDESSKPPSNNGSIEDSKQTNKGLAKVLTIRNISLGIKADGSGGLLSKFTLGGTIRLGPLAGTVEGVGVSAKLEFPSTRDGNLGPVNIGDFKLVPPTGIGLAFQSETISGGGFLSFDLENERYAGVLELTIKDKMSIKAIGLITTRMPDGSKGFSLLILITAEFNPIQLGLGFTLNGVGGLLGLHRTVEVDPLKEGIRANTLDNILFPENPVENAQEIISDLRAVFPPMRGRFVVGPMVLIGWGTPSLITAEIGVVVEITRELSIENLILLGVIKAQLPTPEDATLDLQINFIGILDFRKKYITFDASIFNSRLMDFTLQGDMIFRLKWGEDSNFLMSVGGFHPLYTPPPLDIPEMKRLGIVFFNEPKTKLTMGAYFAVTSNTVQFGARIDLYKGLPFGLKVIGTLGFDALFQFNPFYVLIEFGGSLALINRKGEAVMAVYLNLSIQGPHPWQVNGKAGFKFLKKQHEVKIDFTVGKSKETTLPDINVLPLFQEAFEQVANWSAQLPDSRFLQATLKRIVAAEDEVVAHPAGVLQIVQQIVPLGFAIEKFGTQNPVGATTFDINQITVAGTPLYPAAADYLQDEFAPAQYKNISQDESLRSPSFERYNSGVKVRGSDVLSASHCVSRQIQYESFVIDQPDGAATITSVGAGLIDVARHQSQSEAVSGTIAQNRFATANQPTTLFNNGSGVGVGAGITESYVIATVAEVTNIDADLEFNTYEAAQQALTALIDADPSLEEALQVVPTQTFTNQSSVNYQTASA